MPTYSYMCKSCGSTFDLFRNISEMDLDCECPNCKSFGSSKRYFNAGDSVGIVFKGDGWANKNMSLGKERTKKSKDMARVQKDYYGNDNFV